MFSEKFAVQEKYSLLTQEHISTCERMPVRFTSLRDDRYGPPIDSNIKEKLNKWVEYLPKHVTDSLADHEVDLFIEHKNDVILSYFVKKMMRYEIVNKTNNVWRKFLDEIDCSEITTIRPLLEDVSIENVLTGFYINGIEYDASGNFSGIRVYNSNFNLDSYPFLKEIDKLTTTAGNHSNKVADDSITFYAAHDKIKFNLNFFYASFMKTEVKTPKIITMYPEQVDMYLEAIGEDKLKLVTKEQCDFIKSLCVNDSYFHLTFIYNLLGEPLDIFLYHNTISEFKDLTGG